jgi:hypothetical protein
LLVEIFITKEEERALGIAEHNIVDWRRHNNVSDSDDIKMGADKKKI